MNPEPSPLNQEDWNLMDDTIPRSFIREGSGAYSGVYLADENVSRCRPATCPAPPYPPAYRLSPHVSLMSPIAYLVFPIGQSYSVVGPVKDVDPGRQWRP